MTVHGTARFATRQELKDAGLLGGWTPGAPADGLMLGWWYEDRYDFEPITYRGDLHQLIVGGTGGGKFTTAIAPLLLGSRLEDSTVVVVDPKGEIARLAGPFFQTPFADAASVFVLDPWDLCGTGATASLNVLDAITPESPNYVDDARALADAMIIPSGAENTHWDNAARNFLTAIILYVALAPEEKDSRDLIRVRDIVTQTWAMPKAYTGPKRPTLSELLFRHLTSDLAGGAVRRAFSSLLNREDKERSGIVSSIERDTAWIDSPHMAAVLKGPSLSLKDAALGGGKYFIVLPPDYFMTHRAWLRLMITAFAKAMKRYQPGKDKPQHRRWRHIVIDEFATLGEMSFILNDVAVARGFDVKYHFAVQDLAQLNHIYKEGWHSFINNSFQRFFAVGDLFTMEQVSRIAGQATVESVGTSEGESRTTGQSWGASHSDSHGSSRPLGIFWFGTHTTGASDTDTSGASDSRGWTTSRTTSQVQRALVTPDEVRRLASVEQILLMRGMHPILCRRPPYWEIFPSLPKFSLKEVFGTIGRAPKDEAELAYFTAWRSGLLLMRPAQRPQPLPAVASDLRTEPREAERTRFPYRLPGVGSFLAAALMVLAGHWLGWVILLLIFAPMLVGPALGITERGAMWVVLAALILLVALAFALLEAVRVRGREIIAAVGAWSLAAMAAADLVPSSWHRVTYMLAGLVFAGGAAARILTEWGRAPLSPAQAGRTLRWLLGALFIMGASGFVIKTFLENAAAADWQLRSMGVLIVAAALAGLASALLGGCLAVSAWHLAAPPAPRRGGPEDAPLPLRHGSRAPPAH